MLAPPACGLHCERYTKDGACEIDKEKRAAPIRCAEPIGDKVKKKGSWHCIGESIQKKSDNEAQERPVLRHEKQALNDVNVTGRSVDRFGNENEGRKTCDRKEDRDQDGYRL
ncbi:hypothetical protein D9M70_564680 [compost metagenome]